MNHPDELLSAFLDGEISPEDRDRVSQHLSGCGRCRSELDQLAAVRSAVRGLPWWEMPDLELPPHRRLRFSRSLVGAAMLALAVLVGAVGMAAMPSEEPVNASELSVLLGSYSAAGTRVASFVPVTIPTKGEHSSPLPDELIGYPRLDYRGWDDGGTIAFYGKQGASFAVLTSSRPLDTSDLGADTVEIGGHTYLRAQGNGLVMYVWEADEMWLAVLGSLDREDARAMLAELPPPAAPGLLARVWHSLAP